MSLKNQISSSVKPGDDFFGYANQKWIDSHPIPADKAQYGSFDELNEDNLKKLKLLLEADIKDDEPKMIRLAKQYYRAAMDEDAITANTSVKVKTIVKQITSITNKDQLTDYIAQQHGRGLSLAWALVIEPDDKDSQRNVVRFWQGGLGLPERTYYLEDTPQFVEIRAKYLEFITKLFKLLKLDNPSARAQQVYDLEKALAEASVKAADLRDPEAMYNPYTQDKLQTEFPAFNWTQYQTQAELGRSSVIVGQPGFIKVVNQLVSERPLEQWHNYLLLNMMVILGSKLSKPYENLNFWFFGQVLGGRKQQEPRHIRVTRQLMAMLPEPIGRLYVEHYFDESAKATIQDLVSHIQSAFAARIDQLDWMAADTKKAAHHKLSTFLPLLGYPDKWRSFDELELGDDYADNFLAARRFEWQFETNKLTQPVDRTEWLMSPALVNAYYWPNTNGITFPAGILQPPYFDAKGDFAANYGGIGAVIGHEITHGFDDQGCQFDADGNLKSWWSEADRKNFEARAQQLAKLYSNYEIFGRKVDGQLTLGENIADLGGLLIAYDALQAKLVETGDRQEVDGFSPEQRFFLSYAINWRRHTREPMMLERLVSDPHSPELFRVNGVVSNVDEFYVAFGVKASDKLYITPDNRVRIW